MEIAAVVARVQLQMDDFNRGLEQVRQALNQLDTAVNSTVSNLRTAFSQAAPGAQTLASSLSSARESAESLASAASRAGTVLSRSLGDTEYFARNVSSSIKGIDSALRNVSYGYAGRLSEALHSASTQSTALASSLKQTESAASSFERITASAKTAVSTINTFNSELNLTSLRLTSLGSATGSLSSLRLQAGMAAHEMTSIGTAAVAAKTQSTVAAAAIGGAIGSLITRTKEANTLYAEFLDILREALVGAELSGDIYKDKIEEGFYNSIKQQITALETLQFLKNRALQEETVYRVLPRIRLEEDLRQIANAINSFGLPLRNRAQDVANGIQQAFSHAFVLLRADAKATANQVTRSLQDILTSSENVFDRFRSIGRTTLSSGVVFGGSLFLSARQFANFDHELTRIAVLTGTAKNQVEPLRREIEGLALAYARSTNEVAKSAVQMAQAGYSYEQIREALPATLSAAAATGEDLYTATELIINQLNAFSVQGVTAAHVADALAQATNISSIGMQHLMYSLKYIGPVAAAANMSFDELVAAIALLGNAGIKGEQAGTTLRAAILRLVDPPNEAAETLHKLGISITDTQGRMLPLAVILQQLEQATRNMSEAQKMAVVSTIFGTEAASGMMAILNAGSDALKQYTARIIASDGAAKKMAKGMQSDFYSSLNRVNTALSMLVSSIGQGVAPYLNVLANIITKVAVGFSQLPAPVKYVLGFLATLTATLMTVGGASLILISVMPRLWAVLGAGINVVRGLALAFATLNWRAMLTYAAVALIIYGLSRLFKGFVPSIDTSQLAADTKKVEEQLAKLYNIKPGPVVPSPSSQKSRSGSDSEAAKEAWQKALDGISNRLTTLKAQMDIATASLPAQASEADKLAVRLKYLNQMYDLQNRAVSILSNTYSKYLSTYGETDSRTAAVAEAYAKELQNLRELEIAYKVTAAALSTYGTAIESLRTRLSLLEIEHVRSLASLGAYATAIDKLQTDLAYYERALETQRQLTTALQSRYDALKNSLGENADATRQAYAEWVAAQAAQVNLERAVARTTAAINEQQREMQALQNRLTEITDQYKADLNKAQREYEDRVREANERLQREEKNLTERYREELRRRLVAIRDFTRLFDAIQHRKVKPQTLLGNLQDQVAVLKNFYADLATLQKRGVDESLIEYLRELGPDVANEVRALTMMTDEELALYVQLWREKNELAGEQAKNETEETRKSIEEQIAELRRKTAEELEKYKQEWLEEQAEIRRRTVEALQSLLDEAGRFGQGFVDQLAAGIKDSMPELFSLLNTQTGQILDDISTTFSGFTSTLEDTFNQLDISLASTVSSLDSHLASLRKSIQDTTDAFAGLAGIKAGNIPPMPEMPDFTAIGEQSGEGFGFQWDIGGIASIIAGLGMILVTLARIHPLVAAVTTAIIGLSLAGYELYKHWDQISAWWNQTWEGIKTRAAEAWQSVRDTTTVVWENIRTFLASVWDTIKSAAATTFDTLRTNLASTWDNVQTYTSNVWNSIHSSLASIWGSIRSTGETAWNNLKTALSNATEATRTALSNAWNNILSTLSSIWDNLRERGSSTWETLRATLAEKTSATREALSNIWNDIRNRLATTAENTRDRLADTWENLRGRLSDTATLLKDQLAARWDEIRSRLTETTSSLRSSLETAWNGIRNQLTTTAASIRDDISTTWANLRVQLSSTTDQLRNSLSNAWNGIRDQLTTTAANIRDDVSATWTNLRVQLSSITDQLRNSLSNTWSNIRSTVSNAARGLQDDLISTWNNIKTRLLDIANSIKNGLSSTWSNIRSTVTDLAQSIIDGFKNLASNAWNYGKEVIRSFINGFKSLRIPTPHVSWSVDYRTIAGIRVPIPDIDIEWYAKGGIFTGPSIIGVGEAGAEAVIPLDRLKTYIMDAMRQMMSSAVMKIQVSMEALTPAALQPAVAYSGGTSVNYINVNINGVQDPKAIWDEFETQLRRKGVRF